MTSNPEVQKHGAIRPPLENPLFDFSDSRELGRVTTTVNVTNGKQWSCTHAGHSLHFLEADVMVTPGFQAIEEHQACMASHSWGKGPFALMPKAA